MTPAKFNRTLIILAAAMVSATAVADDLTIPSTFSAGTPARAAEVNANFTAVEASVDDNAADIATNVGEIANNAAAVQDNAAAIAANEAAIASNGRGARILADGVSVGLFLEQADYGRGLYGYRGLSDQNYLFDIVAVVKANEIVSSDPPTSSGDLYTSVVWFESAGCAGQSYTNRTGSVGQLEYHQGFVFRSDDPSDPVQTYYVPSGSREVDLVLSYRRSNLEGGCVFIGTPTNSFAPVLPNDPATTGVEVVPSQTNVLIGN